MAKYLLNAWYAAAHSHEISTKPLARTLLDQPVVLYRTESGVAQALQDRCPHRFAPMSMGKVQGEELECGYHGLRFNGVGACSHNPHGPVPPTARLRSYPVHEQYGVIWFWPGEPKMADPSILPDYSFLTDTSTFTAIAGYLHVKANYQLIVDNLLDLSHALYVHPHFAIPNQTVEQQLSAISTKTITEGNSVTAWRMREMVPPNGPTREIFGFDPEQLLNTRAHMTWFPPSLMRFDAGSNLPGQSEREGLRIPQAHLITPETDLTSHYFFVATRNMKRDDEEAGRKLFAMLDLAFTQQDEPMIEACQMRMGDTSDLDSLNPILLRTDSAPVAARRMLQKLIAEDQGKSGVAAA